MASELMIEANGLTKHYGDVVALDGVDLAVPAGQIYALLGPNGAGKTTTINILTTLIQPSTGTALVGGHAVLAAPDRIRKMIGVTFQDIVLDPDLTGREVLDVHGRLYNMPTAERRSQISALVELVQLSDSIDRIVKTYSGGMKRRLELARGLMTKPRLLFLDEPTQGLDPQNRSAIWEYIQQLNRDQGLTVLLTTHFMDEAETLAHTVGIIDHGHKVAEASPNYLIASLGADVIRIIGQGDNSHLIEKLNALGFVEGVRFEPNGRMLSVSVDNGSRRLAEVISQASGNGFAIEDVSIARPTLGDVFLAHTGRRLRDEQHKG